MERIGFIGLGMMGAPMAAQLGAAGFRLHLLDADAARQGALAQPLGAAVLEAGDAGKLDALITMLPNSAIVEAVLLGKSGNDGWAHKLKPGATVIDMSSSEPERSRALAGVLEALGLEYLDAPVSGGVVRAEKGTLAIMVGGKAEVLERNAPVFAAMGKTLHIGGPGSGHAAKALNNYVSAAGLVATVEALHAARRFGIDPQIMTDVLNASTGRSNTTENKVKQFMLSGTYGSGFALQLMNKDLKIAMALGAALGCPMPLGRACSGIWDAASQHSSPATDHTEMYRLLDPGQQ